MRHGVEPLAKTCGTQNTPIRDLEVPQASDFCVPTSTCHQEQIRNIRCPAYMWGQLALKEHQGGISANLRLFISQRASNLHLVFSSFFLSVLTSLRQCQFLFLPLYIIQAHSSSSWKKKKKATCKLLIRRLIPFPEQVWEHWPCISRSQYRVFFFTPTHLPR